MAEVIAFNPYGNRVYTIETTGWKYVGETRMADFTDSEIKDELILLESSDYYVVKPEWNEFKFGNEKFVLEKR